MNANIETAEEIFARVKPVLDACRQMIVGTGPEGLPSGHLYAMLMKYMDLQTYQKMISVMIQSESIIMVNHVLYARPSKDTE